MHRDSLITTDRRQFLFALGAGLLAAPIAAADEELLSLGKQGYVDWKQLAADGHVFEHWTPEEDSTWKWYRLERYRSGSWETVGISLPMNKESGESFEPPDGYVVQDQIPAFVLQQQLPELPVDWQVKMAPSQFDPQRSSEHEPDQDARARDGRPATEWLRSLTAEELRTWLKTVKPPEAGVSGMTFWVHLVRDHGFDPRRINGLTEAEFRVLHSAAHYGY